MRVILLLGLLCSLSACGKKEAVESTEDFGEISTSVEESTEDEFAIGQDNKNLPGYEVRETTKSYEEQREIVDKKLEEELAAIEATRDVEQESKEIAINEVHTDDGEVLMLTEIEDGIVEVLTQKIMDGEITSMDEVRKQLDTGNYSLEYREDLDEGFEAFLEYWIERRKELENDPILDMDILEENPDWYYHTQTEYDAVKAYESEAIEKAGGEENIHKELNDFFWEH